MKIAVRIVLTLTLLALSVIAAMPQAAAAGF
jgi:hypothetical protein